MPTHSLCLLSYCPLPHPHPFLPGLMQCPLTSSLSSVAQSYPTVCDPMDCSTPGLPVHHQLPEFTQTHVHGWWCHPTISSSAVPFSSCLQSFPALNSFQMSQLAKVLEFQLQHHPNECSGLISFRMDWMDLLAVQRTQESSPAPQFKSIDSLALSFIYCPTLTSIHDYQKKHSFH